MLGARVYGMCVCLCGMSVCGLMVCVYEAGVRRCGLREGSGRECACACAVGQ